MNEPDKNINIRTTSIPSVFYDSSTGNPFAKCLSCSSNLFETNIPYIIEKAIKQFKEYEATDIIFEYAMCMNCYEEIASTMSESSKKNINAYYQAHVNFDKRRSELSDSVDEWISSCLIKGTQREMLSEYQIIGQFQGQHMLFYNLPVLIGDTAMDEMMQLLSNETLGEMGRFKDRFLGVPPEWRDLFENKKFVLI
jgi:hypothetical protein